VSWAGRLPGPKTVRGRRLPYIAWYVALILLLSLFGPLVSNVVRMLGVLVAVAIGGAIARRGSRTIPTLQLVPVVLVLVFTAAASDGLGPWQSQAQYVTVDADSGVANGWYGRLGADSTSIYLQSCDQPDAPVVAVPLSLVRSVRYAPIQHPSQIGSLVDLIEGHGIRVGYLAGCPHPSP